MCGEGDEQSQLLGIMCSVITLRIIKILMKVSLLIFPAIRFVEL